MLRLVSTTIGPVSIAAGSNGPSRVAEAYNAGDGTLTLAASSSAPWAVPTVGKAGPCTTTNQSSTPCIPITVALNTASLTAGTQTAILTITGDATTVDAPQTITVTVAIGGSVPSAINVYVPPNGSVDVPASTNSNLRWQATTQDGNNWLSMTISGNGSFGFQYPWNVHIAAQPANPPGVYSGNMTLSGSSFAGDNKSIPVTMTVTTQPIAQGPPAVNLRLAQGAPPLAAPYTAVPVTLTNAGQGTLTVTSVGNVSAGPCPASWLTVAQTASGASLTVDPTGLSTGTCGATLSILSNAVNSPTQVPVTLQVVAKGPPLINFQGVVDNATFAPGGSVSPGDIVLAKGEQFSFEGASLGGYTPGPAPPLPYVLGGASVTVDGTAAPLFYSFYGQLAFQIPMGTQVGTAVVQAKRDDGAVGNLASVAVVARAPGILIITKQDYSVPGPSNPAHVGDALLIWSIGMGPTSPAVSTGQPAPPYPGLATLIDPATVTFGAGLALVPPATATPFFAGLASPFAGLYQINVVIPPGCPTGTVYVSVTFPDGTFSNTEQITVQ